jgi:hypothetical protein
MGFDEGKRPKKWIFRSSGRWDICGILLRLTEHYLKDKKQEDFLTGNPIKNLQNDIESSC